MTKLFGMMLCAGVGVVLCLGGLACDKNLCTQCGGDNGDPKLYGAATTPDSLLQNLLACYAERDHAQLDSLLAEDFVFIFSSLDRADPDVPSDDIDRVLEAQIHERMFDAEHTQTLTFGFEYEPSSLEYDGAISTPGDSLWTMLVTSVDLLVYGATPLHPEEFEAYDVEAGVLQFWFRKTDQVDPASGRRLWTIARCKEHNFGGGGGKPAADASWGSIKSLYRQPWPVSN